MVCRILLCAAAFYAALPPTLPARTWTDRAGNVEEAEFISCQSGKVWLRTNDGRTVEVPLTALSPADQEFVREQVKQEEARLAAETTQTGGEFEYGAPRKLAEIASPAVSESSGLAVSRRHEGLFWTHNDSGDDPRLYLFDREGRDLGWCELDGVQAFDWEDLAGFSYQGKSYLLVCDVGNNGRSAGVHMMYLVEEPDEPPRAAEGRTVPVTQTIHFAYDDDFRNCEAVAVDPTDRTILLVSKELGRPATVYSLAWPPIDAEKPAKACRIGELRLPAVTAIDVSADGRRAIVLTYAHAYEYTRRSGQSWAEAFASKPRQIKMPERVQGESICYGLDGKTLYLTSEKRPAPLWEVAPQGK